MNTHFYIFIDLQLLQNDPLFIYFFFFVSNNEATRG